MPDAPVFPHEQIKAWTGRPCPPASQLSLILLGSEESDHADLGKCGGWGRGAGFTCSARLMAALLPVGPLTSKASRAQGARGCPNSRQQAGSCEVQHWGFLSPLGFTHPLSMRRVSPPPAPLCVRVF